MKKVFVEGNNHPIVNMFLANDWGVTSSLDHADLVCFEGGADVSPELYGEENNGSYCSAGVDFNSFVLYNNAKRLLLPMVGICRGGQFLNVMAGGKMIQDHPGHTIAGTHLIHYTKDYGDDVNQCQVTSTHHQIMVVNGHGSDLVGWVPGHTKEVEIVHHWQENTLSFQPHPEYVDKDHECQILFFDLLHDFLLV